MARLPLTNGGYTVVDDCDLHWLSRFNWHWHQSDRSHSKYAATFIGQSMIYMHRLVVGECGKGMVADHIDHDGLNNRRANLRVCHYSQNSANSRKFKVRGASRFKGVIYRDGKWRAGVQRNGKRTMLGPFATEVEAARAYDAKVEELDGPFACTNAGMGLL